MELESVYLPIKAGGRPGTVWSLGHFKAEYGGMPRNPAYDFLQSSGQENPATCINRHRGSDMMKRL